jgi:predicted ATPase
VEIGVEATLASLKNIFILDPIPAHMRDYSTLADSLLPDGANIAGVIAAFPDGERKRLEGTLTKFAGHLPEKDVRRIYAERVGKFLSDAMLYCDEQWSGSQSLTVDARGMSDGTLRFLAILTALLTRPSRSLLIVEEIDNGLHPSRATLLLRILREMGQERQIDVVVTTHNPAFLDAAGPSLVPFITVAHREPSTGFSQLTLLEDIHQLSKLLASAPVGTLSAQGRLEKALERTS